MIRVSRKRLPVLGSSIALHSHQLLRIQAQILAGTGSINSLLMNQRCISYSASPRCTSQLPSLCEVSGSIEFLIMPTSDEGVRLRTAGVTVKLCSIVQNLHVCGTGQNASQWARAVVARKSGNFAHWHSSGIQ